MNDPAAAAADDGADAVDDARAVLSAHVAYAALRAPCLLPRAARALRLRVSALRRRRPLARVPLNELPMEGVVDAQHARVSFNASGGALAFIAADGAAGARSTELRFVARRDIAWRSAFTDVTRAAACTAPPADAAAQAEGERAAADAAAAAAAAARVAHALPIALHGYARAGVEYVIGGAVAMRGAR
jgi:hypothetical protein